MTQIEVTEDPAARVADMLCEQAAAGGDIVLTGGSTPQVAYELAAGRDVDWSSTRVWFGDERCVAPDDPRSNYGMAAAALLERLPEARRPLVLRIEAEHGPQEGADRYERLLRAELGPEPRFDLLLLGLGGDGHMASLFPGKPAVQERSRLVVGVPEAGLEPFVARVSLTVTAINAAHRRVFLVAGESKAGAVARAFGAERDPTLPASLADDPLVILDPAAAAKL